MTADWNLAFFIVICLAALVIGGPAIATGVSHLFSLMRGRMGARETRGRRRPTDLLGQLVWDYKLDRITDFGEVPVVENGQIYLMYLLWVDFDGGSHRIEIDPRDLALSHFPQILIRQVVAQLVDEKRSKA